MDSFSEAWEIVCSYCKTKITDVAYKTWISRIKPLNIDFDKNTATLLVPNDFHRQTLTRCYLPLLIEAIEAIFGHRFTIDFKIPDEIEEKTETKPIVEQEIPDANYEYTFDTFIVGSSNKFAHAACLAVATNPARAYNPLFLHGNSGLGKTHLLYAIGNEIKKNDPSKVICYIKGDDFTNDLIESLRLAKMSEFRQKYRQADILLVDDVQFIGGKESTQEEFFHTFNALYDAKKQIVLTSDRPPKEIKTLDDRLRSRFEMDLIADVQPPDIETRIAIIKRKAELLEIEVSNDVCEYIASKIKANIRQLEGTVKKLKAKSLLNHEKPTISTAQEVISDILNNDIPPEVTVEKIIDEVARTYGVTSDEIRSQKNRSSNISNARHIAIYVTRELTTLSMVAIGEEFGDRHYSTIIYTVKKVQQMMEKDRKVREIVEDTIKNIRDRQL
ncbi:MAG: chromosomal replication initiator protein DnaA [Ruminococcus sp.]|nr:chromosomal replication initiator protein DnaA [Ruminococcus sp.]